MAKITGEVLYELLKDSVVGVGKIPTNNNHPAQPFEIEDEDVQQLYNDTAKKLNDYLTYGHLPKKED